MNDLSGPDHPADHADRSVAISDRGGVSAGLSYKDQRTTPVRGGDANRTGVSGVIEDEGLG